MKNILITGVSKGVGRQLAIHFSQIGFYVHGVYKYSGNYTNEKGLADSLISETQNIQLYPLDLADTAETDEFISKVSNIKFHAIVNNAAEFLDNGSLDFSADKWDRSLAVNLTAPLRIVSALKNNFEEGGSVVNIASSDADFAAYNDVGYAASKAGLLSVTKSLAAVMAPIGVRVNAVSPGWVDTEMAENAGVDELAHDKTPMGRNAKVEEIAQVVDFLISTKASFVNGANIAVDGGYSIVDYVVKKESENA